MFAQEFSDAAEGLGFNHAALKDLFNSALDEPLKWWRMRGLDHLSFREFVGFLARSPVKVAGAPPVAANDAAAPPVAVDGAAAPPVEAVQEAVPEPSAGQEGVPEPPKLLALPAPPKLFALPVPPRHLALFVPPKRLALPAPPKRHALPAPLKLLALPATPRLPVLPGPPCLPAKQLAPPWPPDGLEPPWFVPPTLPWLFSRVPVRPDHPWRSLPETILPICRIRKLHRAAETPRNDKGLGKKLFSMLCL